jgi:hypothetical protein
MKHNKDSFPMNMNLVELDGKKVLVWPSRVELNKGKEAVIGEDRPLRMIKPMVEERRKTTAAVPKGHLQHPYGQVQGRQG